MIFDSVLSCDFLTKSVGIRAAVYPLEWTHQAQACSIADYIHIGVRVLKELTELENDLRDRLRRILAMIPY